MNELSFDYAGMMSSLQPPLKPTLVGAALLTARADRYEAEQRDCALLQFEQSGASYLFDLASSADLPQEDRTIAAWALAARVVDQRDTAYQRGFPMAPGADDAAVDRGHLIPNLSGGEFGPNIFRQDRALNRGWSEQGKRYRALEREAGATPGTFTSGTSYTPTTPPTLPRSRAGSSAAVRCTSSGSTTARGAADRSQRPPVPPAPDDRSATTTHRPTRPARDPLSMR